MKRRILAALLLALPLFVGAIVAGATNVEISSSWNSSEEEQGAPAAVADSEAIIAAHQAASQAASQSSFLLMGTEQLVEGVGQLVAAAPQLTEGTAAARSGAAELAQGMVEIQAGTGQLGEGATQLADAMDEAVTAAAGIEAVRGQTLLAIDNAIAELRESESENAPELIAMLQDLRQQAVSYAVTDEIIADLREAQSGARTLANQLSVSGYAYHDGIYQATQGAQALAEGLAELDAGAQEAVDGIAQLEDGAAQVDDMANTTADRITAIQRSLPAVASTSTDDGEAAPSQLLPPLYAFLIAGFVMFTATTWRRGSWVLNLISGLAIVGLAAGLVAILGTNVTATSVAAVAAIAVIAIVAAAAGATVAMRMFGAVAGSAVALVLLALQAAFVGWVWNDATTQSISNGIEFLVRLLPLHYATEAISTVGNGIWSESLWISVGVLAAFGLLALICSRFILPKPQPAVQAVAQPVAQPVAAPVAETVAQPVAAPVDEAVAEPVASQATEAAEQPGTVAAARHRIPQEIPQGVERVSQEDTQEFPDTDQFPQVPENSSEPESKKEKE